MPEPEVARRHGARGERPDGGVGPPVAGRHQPTPHHDLAAHVVAVEAGPGLGVAQEHLGALDRGAVAGQLEDRRAGPDHGQLRALPRGQHFDGPARRQPAAPHAHDRQRSAGVAERHRQRRLGHAVAGDGGLGAEPEGREALGEAGEHARLHRFAAAAGPAPAREVDAGQRVVADGADGLLVAERGRGRPSGAGGRDRAQPHRGIGQEVERAQQVEAGALQEAEERGAHQAEVVVQREPRGDGLVGIEVHPRRQRAAGLDDVGVGDRHDAAGGRRAARELEVRHAVGAGGAHDVLDADDGRRLERGRVDARHRPSHLRQPTRQVTGPGLGDHPRRGPEEPADLGHPGRLVVAPAERGPGRGDERQPTRQGHAEERQPRRLGRRACDHHRVGPAQAVVAQVGGDDQGPLEDLVLGALPERPGRPVVEGEDRAVGTGLQTIGDAAGQVGGAPVLDTRPGAREQRATTPVGPPARQIARLRSGPTDRVGLGGAPARNRGEHNPAGPSHARLGRPSGPVHGSPGEVAPMGPSGPPAPGPPAFATVAPPTGGVAHRRRSSPTGDRRHRPTTTATTASNPAPRNRTRYSPGAVPGGTSTVTTTPSAPASSSRRGVQPTARAGMRPRPGPTSGPPAMGPRRSPVVSGANADGDRRRRPGRHLAERAVDGHHAGPGCRLRRGSRHGRRVGRRRSRVGFRPAVPEAAVGAAEYGVDHLDESIDDGRHRGPHVVDEVTASGLRTRLGRLVTARIVGRRRARVGGRGPGRRPVASGALGPGRAELLVEDLGGPLHEAGGHGPDGPDRAATGDPAGLLVVLDHGGSLAEDDPVCPDAPRSGTRRLVHRGSWAGVLG